MSVRDCSIKLINHLYKYVPDGYIQKEEWLSIIDIIVMPGYFLISLNSIVSKHLFLSFLKISVKKY